MSLVNSACAAGGFRFAAFGCFFFLPPLSASSAPAAAMAEAEDGVGGLSPFSLSLPTLPAIMADTRERGGEGGEGWVDGRREEEEQFDPRLVTVGAAEFELINGNHSQPEQQQERK